ncbi:MAG: hypothetical protein AAGE03_08700 [Pseudomonadota bacterium]
MTIVLIVVLLVGALVMSYGGIACGIWKEQDHKQSQDGEPSDGGKRAAVGIVVVGAILYGAAGTLLWHWSVAMTAALLVLVVGFAVYATEEKLDG